MDVKDLFAIFKTAIDNERDAYDFYRTAAAGASDPETRELFEELADTELGHERKLEKRYRELKGKYSGE